VLRSVFNETESRASEFVCMFYKCESNVLMLKLSLADFARKVDGKGYVPVGI
jgi:hypothetical protein